MAQHILQDLLGVKGIINRKEILPKTKANNIESQITKAYERLAGLETKGICVQVDGDTVQLKGRVHFLRNGNLQRKPLIKHLVYGMFSMILSFSTILNFFRKI